VLSTLFLLAACSAKAPRSRNAAGAVAAPAEEAPAREAEMLEIDADYAEAAPASMGSGLGGQRTRSAPQAAQPAAPGKPGPAQPAAKPKTVVEAPANKQAAQSKPKPMLIYTAVLTMAVFEAARAIDEVEKHAREVGGYLVRRTDNSITVRVPAEVFDSSLETVSKVGDELHRDVSVRDVTAEFRDLQTRLKNLQAVRDRLQVLLAKASNVPQALQVERELERVTGEIERIKGRMKLYSELVAFSTITINFQARPVEKISSTVELPFPWLQELGLSRLLDL
jgi:hypothetical protein